MKIFLPLFFICFILSSVKAQTVSFVHVGQCEKPMPDLYIKPGNARTYEVSHLYKSRITTDQEIFEALLSYVFENKAKAYDFLAEKGTAFGTYDITVISDDHNGLSYSLTMYQARTFFKGLLPLVKMHTEFYDDVEKLTRRLE